MQPAQLLASLTSWRAQALPAQTLASLTLRLGLLAQAWGLYLIATSKGTAINGLVFLSLDWPEPTARLIDQGGATLTAALAAACLWGPRAWMLWLIFAWSLAVAAASWHQGGFPFSQYSVWAWGARLALPLVLWRHSASDDPQDPWIDRLARAGLAATFALHGVEALSLHPAFVDLILAAGQRFFDQWWAQQTAHATLRIIGVVDLVVASALLLGRRWRPLVLYMALWGAVTALSRVVEWGSLGLGEAALRAAHGALPLALWWRWRAQGAPAARSADQTPDQTPDQAPDHDVTPSP